MNNLLYALEINKKGKGFRVKGKGFRVKGKG
jgi:hypothetical protein